MAHLHVSHCSAVDVKDWSIGAAWLVLSLGEIQPEQHRRQRVLHTVLKWKDNVTNGPGQ